MARHGITVHATSESDPRRAVALLAAGAPLAAALPHDHDHSHVDQQTQAQVQLQIQKP